MTRKPATLLIMASTSQETNLPVVQRHHLRPSYRARARPRIPAAPAKLIARPPVAAGAPAVEVEDEPEPDVDELDAPPLVVVSTAVAVEVEAAAVEESGVDETPLVLNPTLEPIKGVGCGTSLHM